MYVEKVERYKLTIRSSSFDHGAPVIEEGSKEVITMAYALAKAYTKNGKLRKIQAIKAIRDMTNKLDDRMWSLKGTKLFIDAVIDEWHDEFGKVIKEIFYEPIEEDYRREDDE